MSTLRLGILGCGNFLRRMAPDLKASTRVTVSALYDSVRARAEHYAQMLGGRVAESADGVLVATDVDAVCLFVPPWVRHELWLRAAAAHKHSIATKPLSANTAACKAMVKAAKKIVAGVLYRRTGNAVIETYKRIFERGEIGRLALYKQDWLHHYPQWNTWALDREKNGGPFMDAMIHNLNIARHLMGRPMTACTFFSDSHAHQLPCADTEAMKCDFANNGSAHIFITWAADLAVHSTAGNDREHIDITYMITDQGWRLTDGRRDDQSVIIAAKDGHERIFPIEPFAATPFDAFAAAVLDNVPLRRDIVPPREAADDIALLRYVEQRVGKQVLIRNIVPRITL
jgi:predicted dehydrogenase